MGSEGPNAADEVSGKEMGRSKGAAFVKLRSAGLARDALGLTNRTMAARGADGRMCVRLAQLCMSWRDVHGKPISSAAVSEEVADLKAEVAPGDPGADGDGEGRSVGVRSGRAEESAGPVVNGELDHAGEEMAQRTEVIMVDRASKRKGTATRNGTKKKAQAGKPAAVETAGPEDCGKARGDGSTGGHDSGGLGYDGLKRRLEERMGSEEARRKVRVGGWWWEGCSSNVRTHARTA